MARVQLYSKTDKRLVKEEVNTSYKRNLRIWKITSFILLIPNIYFIIDKLLK